MRLSGNQIIIFATIGIFALAAYLGSTNTEEMKIIQTQAIEKNEVTTQKEPMSDNTQPTEQEENEVVEARDNDACDSYTCFTKPSENELLTMLTPIQYKVTQQDGTEKPFNNEYWDNEEEGIYVDVISGEPLFSSKDKYVSGTGWPSFVKPIDDSLVTLHEDRKFFSVRTEVRSAIADSHLGHVFDDGPEDRGGKRWCMNSAALKFIPKTELTGDYAQYASLFE